MKKIVGIIAAVAMATSVFAADVSAKAKLDGSLLKKEGDKITALEIEHVNQESWNPVVSMSVSGDKAGATANFFVGPLVTGINGWQKGYQILAKEFKIWFKPFDVLQINLGNVASNLNQEMIDWSSTDSGVDSEGYGLAINAGDISFEAIFAPGWNANWMEKANADADAVIADTYFKFQYNGGDIGTINAMLRGKSTFKDLAFGLGYKNVFGGVTVFENVLGYYNAKFNKVRSETYAQGNVDAFGWAIWLPLDINLGDETTAALGTTLKLSYNINGVNAYLYVKEANWIDFASVEVKPGCTGSVGSMGYEVAFDMTIGKDGLFNFNVPVNFTVNW